MFQKTRYRLLVNNVLVLALVLAGFALAVWVVFARNLKQQMLQQLTLLGQNAAAEVESASGNIKIDKDVSEQTPISAYQGLEWFDHQGHLMHKRGEYFPLAPLRTQASGVWHSPNAFVDFSPEGSIQSVVVPILGHETQETIGYVRVNQLLDEFDETLWQLNVGLGAGVIVAIALGSGGILWLNRQAMQPIEESFARLKQFTADASHELRSPLMAISSNVEVALKYPEGMRPDDRDVMNAVASAADQMTRLSEDLLLLARTDSLSSVEPVAVDLSDLLKDVIQLYRPQAEAKQIALSVVLGPNLTLQGDPVGLTRAFTNLLQNAIRYTSEGGKISIEAKHLGHQLTISIQDTGVGIASHQLEKIFERFWRADQARQYDDGGSGLGLPITQAIVQSHQGTVDVISHLGSGSCFTVRLPSL